MFLIWRSEGKVQSLWSKWPDSKIYHWLRNVDFFGFSQTSSSADQTRASLLLLKKTLILLFDMTTIVNLANCFATEFRHFFAYLLFIQSDNRWQRMETFQAAVQTGYTTRGGNVQSGGWVVVACNFYIFNRWTSFVYNQRNNVLLPKIEDKLRVLGGRES